MKIAPKYPIRPLDRTLGFIHSLPSSDRLFFHILAGTLLVSALLSVIHLNSLFSNEVSVKGGEIVEGIVGSPRFINPILASTQADKTAQSLIYEGLMTYDENGVLIPLLASEVTLSDDKKTYEITLRTDVLFHDGTPLTAEDVVFTYERIQDPETKSPLRGNWNTATINQTGEYSLTITLDEPYIPFVHNLTTGIVPAHLYADIPARDMSFSTNNTNPIGTGPFQVTKTTRNDHGTVTAFELSTNPHHRTSPHLESVTLKFFENHQELETALAENKITGTADIPLDKLEQYEKGEFEVVSNPLPQVFGIFFNQNRSELLRERIVRTALHLSLDRDKIIENALYGYGYIATSTIPGTKKDTDGIYQEGAGQQLLRDNGWQRNDDGIWQYSDDDDSYALSFTIQTTNDPVLARVAEEIASQWREFGAEIKVEQYEQSDLLNSIIRPRTFTVVLFGIEPGRQLDLYPFWHSSQQTDPGLNIAQYANISIDEALETIRETPEPDIRNEKTGEVVATLQEELPALFVYTPTINHVRNKSLNTPPYQLLQDVQQRFSTIDKWHTQTDTLWPIFYPYYRTNTE